MLQTRKRTRRETAEELKARGYRVSVSTLAQLASRGDGPPFVIFGRDALYDLDAALTWAERRQRPPRRSGRSSSPVQSEGVAAV